VDGRDVKHVLGPVLGRTRCTAMTMKRRAFDYSSTT
jgi:hypothetical protein